MLCYAIGDLHYAKFCKPDQGVEYIGQLVPR